MKKRSIIFVFIILLFSHFTVNADENVKIAFIDSGISTKYIDGSHIEKGKNYIFPQNDTEDRIGHGTATAGAVLGSADGLITGACPTASAVPLVVCDRYPSGVIKNGDISLICKAIYDAVDEYGCQIINISMGVPKKADELENAVLYAEEKGVVIVSAVGNDNLIYSEREYYPAGYDTVIGVGASDGGNVFEISQRNGVKVVAEGKAVPSVGIRNFSISEQKNGTSYSCAFVSGICAEIITQTPKIKPSVLRSSLYALADDIDELGFDENSGWGKIDFDLFDKKSITRGKFVKLLYILNGETSETLKNGFSDTDKTEFQNAAAWAKENKIVYGKDENSFAPNEFISEYEAAVIINRYAQRKVFDDEAALKKEININEMLMMFLQVYPQ